MDSVKACFQLAIDLEIEMLLLQQIINNTQYNGYRVRTPSVFDWLS